MADRPVETWICQFIQRHVWIYDESLIVDFVPISVSVDVFLRTRRARAQNSKSVSRKCLTLSARSATTGPQPVKVKFLYVYLVNSINQGYCSNQPKLFDKGSYPVSSSLSLSAISTIIVRYRIISPDLYDNLSVR